MSYFLEDFEVKEAYGCKWLKIFYHNSSTKVFFNKSKNEHLSSNSEEKYSILGALESIHRFDNSFEFLLEYPELQGYNRWIQTVNPLGIKNPTTRESLGYESINETWSCNYCGGFTLSINQNTFICGAIGHSSHWVFAIGSFSNYGTDNTFPGPTINDENGNATNTHKISYVYLWIRVKQFHSLFNSNCSSCRYNDISSQYSKIKIFLMSICFWSN